MVTDVVGASAVSARKTRHLSTPTDTMTATVNPGAAKETLEIGDPVTFSSDRLGIENMISRVVDVTETSDKGIEVSLQEDIFNLVDTSFTSDSGTVSVIAGLAKPQRQRIIELPYDAVGENLELLFLFSRGSQSQNGVTIYESADDVEYSQVDQIQSYAAAGVLAQDYPDTPKIDRQVGVIFDADNSDILETPSLNESQFLLHQQLALIDNEIIAISPSPQSPEEQPPAAAGASTASFAPLPTPTQPPIRPAAASSTSSPRIPRTRLPATA